MKRSILFSMLTLHASILAFAQNGLNFDGVDDVVDAPSSGIWGSADRTFEAWVFVPASAPASNLCILDYGLDQVGSRNTFSVSGNRALTYISGGINTNIGTGPNAVPVNQWAHVAFVLNNGTGFLYVNGVQQGTGNLSGVNTPAGNQGVRIGERVTGASIPFHGTIDEVRVWSVARSQAEIQANMNAELCSLQPGLELDLRFNEGVAGGNNLGVTTTQDYSGNLIFISQGILIGFDLIGSTSNFVTGASLAPGLSLSFGSETACNSFMWTADSTTYTASGLYHAVMVGANAQGCDSIAELLLTIDTVDTSVMDNGDLSITANAANATYQWLDCNDSFAMIPGATDQTYMATGNGSYAVEVTANGCTDTSACVTIGSTGMDLLERTSSVSLFPNPTTGHVIIEASEPLERIDLIQLDGSVVRRISTKASRVSIDLSELAKGVYLVKVSPTHGQGSAHVLMVE